MIHPTAIIDPRAEIDPSAHIGPYVIIDGSVKIGPHVRIEAHAQVLNNTTIGAGSRIGHAAIIGGDPQDLSFDPATPSLLIIGERNVIREHVTMHRGSKPGSATRIGDDNFIMASAHFAHDVHMGNRCVMANSALFGGHVHVGNNVFIGGGAAFHQFVRVGDYCMVGGNASISKDVPPYCMVQMENLITGLNVVGMRRAGFSPEERSQIKGVFGLVFRSGHNISQALENVSRQAWAAPCERFIDFISVRNKRGLCRVRLSKTEDS
jgi:UDP-N-acetylglucosamine acyltransferase